MLNIGTGELMLIVVIALLVLGPTRLPEFARGIGKFVREFRRQTDDVRVAVEREFYRMDDDVQSDKDKKVLPPPDTASPGQALLAATQAPTPPEAETGTVALEAHPWARPPAAVAEPAAEAAAPAPSATVTEEGKS